ncbi:polymorphic toxin-type HINT domain-containing protein [Microbacterium sp. NPDC087592]|uniref:polymorphic toxin-type HINT domain-containing protein n=1 Tax=Microbacterium sp. NPDC087592 TaxID=3364193 RepID=UPI0038006721
MAIDRADSSCRATLRIAATDPETGKTSARPVVTTITGTGVKDLVTVSVTDASGQTGQVTATAGHPFWVPDIEEWVDAGELRPGMWVQTSSGTWVQVTAIEHDHREQTVHNLTIDTTHTYSVYAGADAVVTHNCGTGATGSPRLPSQLSGGSATNSVYIGVRAGDDVYVGITNNVARRTDQHGARFDTLQVIGTSLTRGESRAVEQALIVQNSGFENLINSISPRHSFYDQAVEWGRAWLTANGR